MELRSLLNGGIVIVDSAFGQRLLDGGGWEVVGNEAPKPVETPKTTRRTRKTPAPVEEPKTEE